MTGPPGPPPSERPDRAPSPPPDRAREPVTDIIRIGPPDPVRTGQPQARHGQGAGHRPTGPAIANAEPASSARPATAVIELRGIGLRGDSQRRLRALRWRQPQGQHRRRQWRAGQSPDDRSADPGLLDLTVWRGELVTLTGPAGSGKSALLGVIGLLDQPATGRYLLTGLDTAELGDRDRAALRCRQIGLQLQRPALLAQRSALDNVALPLRYVGLPRQLHRIAAFTALDIVGLASQAQLTVVQLSAAQRRLVAIARALVADPGLLLFDDPTASLDQATAAQVTSLLVGLCRTGRTVVAVTDDQLTAAHSSQRIILAGQARAPDWPGEGTAGQARQIGPGARR